MTDTPATTYRRTVRSVADHMAKQWARNLGDDRLRVARDLGDADVAALALELGNRLSDADRSTLVALLMLRLKP